MPQDDIAQAWLGFDESKRTRLLGKMSPEQKANLRKALESRSKAAAPAPTPDKTQFEQGKLPEGNAAVRGLKSFAAPFVDTAKGVYHTAVDAPSGTAEIAAASTPAGLQLYRMFVKPGIEEKRKADESAAEGHTSESMGHSVAAGVPVLGPWAASVAEKGGEQAGEGDYAGAAGTVAGNVALYEAPKALGKVKLPAPRVVRELVKDTEKANAETASKAAEASKKAKAQNIETERAHADKIAATKSANEATLHEQAKIRPTQEKLTTATRELQAQIETARAKALKEGNAKYSAVNEALSGQPAGIDHVRDAMHEAQSRISGTQAEPPILKSIRDRINGNELLNYGDLQGYYTELGRELSKGTLPGDLYTAYDTMHEAIGDEMQKIADANGQGAQLTDARNYWRRMKQAFGKPYNATDAATSGVLEKASPEQARADEFHNRVRQLGVFDKTIPQTVEHISNIRKGLKSLGEEKPVRDAVKPLPPKPKLESVPAKPAPKKIGATEVESAKEGHLQKRADQLRNSGVFAALYAVRHGFAGMSTIGDVAFDATAGLAATHAVANVLENPRVVKFLTKATARDVAAIPSDLRGSFPKVIQAAQSKGIKVSPALLGAFANASRGPAPRKQHPSDAYSDPANWQ